MANEPQAEAPTNGQSAEEISKHAWQHFAKKEYVSAVEEFRKAITKNAGLIDAVYGFAMSLRYKGDSEGAIRAFEQTLKMIDEGVVSDANRVEMLARLSKSHITFLKTGTLLTGSIEEENDS